jgi:hypothetical protein
MPAMPRKTKTHPPDRRAKKPRPSVSHAADSSAENRPKAIAEHITYATWKARAAAMLERQAAAMMRERDWRQPYVRGKAPEDAARQAETLYLNTRPAVRAPTQAMTNVSLHHQMQVDYPLVTGA